MNQLIALHVNLLERYSEADQYRYETRFHKFKKKDPNYFTEEHPKFKVGDIIEFTSGFNDDIRYTSKILGFDTDGEIYVLWDCYWSPIKDNEISNIKKV